jgi:hypothetical protein
LHGCGADPAGRAGDEHSFSGLDVERNDLAVGKFRKRRCKIGEFGVEQVRAAGIEAGLFGFL